MKEYKGLTFKNKNETAWAVFFDFLGCEWKYLPEGDDGPTYRVEKFQGGCNLYVGPLATTMHKALKNEMGSDFYVVTGYPDFKYYAGVVCGSPSSVMFCGGDSNNMNIESRFIDPYGWTIDDAGFSEDFFTGYSEYFWPEYVKAVIKAQKYIGIHKYLVMDEDEGKVIKIPK
jgi:hypothetical protein